MQIPKATGWVPSTPAAAPPPQTAAGRELQGRGSLPGTSKKPLAPDEDLTGGAGASFSSELGAASAMMAMAPTPAAIPASAIAAPLVPAEAKMPKSGLTPALLPSQDAPTTRAAPIVANPRAKSEGLPTGPDVFSRIKDAGKSVDARQQAPVVGTSALADQIPGFEAAAAGRSERRIAGENLAETASTTIPKSTRKLVGNTEIAPAVPGTPSTSRETGDMGKALNKIAGVSEPSEPGDPREFGVESVQRRKKGAANASAIGIF